MSRQYFADTLTEPAGADFATITATTETVLIPTALTPIPALEPRAGKVYELLVGGTVTTGASGTMGITPRLGTTISGTVIGAISALQTVVPSITLAPFFFRCNLIIRSVGLPGANSTCLITCYWSSGGAIATASSETACGQFGSLATADFSIAQALWIGVTFSIAPSIIPKWHVWRSLN